MLFDKPRVHNGVSDPVGLVFIYDFLEDVVERFVGRFGKSISLRIIRCALFMEDHVVSLEFPDFFVNKVTSRGKIGW